MCIVVSTSSPFILCALRVTRTHTHTHTHTQNPCRSRKHKKRYVPDIDTHARTHVLYGESRHQIICIGHYIFVMHMSKVMFALARV
jgi:hypothetical protein